MCDVKRDDFIYWKYSNVLCYLVITIEIEYFGISANHQML